MAFNLPPWSVFCRALQHRRPVPRWEELASSTFTFVLYVYEFENIRRKMVAG